jgi:hypothetical protein
MHEIVSSTLTHRSAIVLLSVQRPTPWLNAEARIQTAAFEPQRMAQAPARHGLSVCLAQRVPSFCYRRQFQDLPKSCVSEMYSPVHEAVSEKGPKKQTPLFKRPKSESTVTFELSFDRTGTPFLDPPFGDCDACFPGGLGTR